MSSARPRGAVRRWPAALILAVATVALAGAWIPRDSPVATSPPTITEIAALVTVVLLLP